MSAGESSFMYEDLGRVPDESLIHYLRPLSAKFTELRVKLKQIEQRSTLERDAETKSKALLKEELEQTVIQMSAPATELFTRHRAAACQKLTKLIRRGGLCPIGWVRDTFVDHCLDRAYENMLARIRGFEFRGSFAGWLSAVAQTTALDEFDKESRDTALLPETEFVKEKQSGDEGPSISPLDRLSSTMQYLPEHEWMKGSSPAPDAAEMERENSERARRQVDSVRKLYEQYEAVSDRNAESLRFIRQNRIHGMTHEQIAAKRYGEPTTEKERQRQNWRVSQKILRNCRGIRELCGKLYGATSFQEVWRRL